MMAASVLSKTFQVNNSNLSPNVTPKDKSMQQKFIYANQSVLDTLHGVYTGDRGK